MNRPELRRLTQERVRDADILLASGQWAGAYHMTGYALECALKSCILKLIDDTGVIFKDKWYLDKLAKCWTHDLEQLDAYWVEATAEEAEAEVFPRLRPEQVAESRKWA